MKAERPMERFLGIGRDFVREGRLVFSLSHLGLVVAALIIAYPGVALSMGLSDRGLLVMGRAVIPLLAVLYVPGLVLREAMLGRLEFVATSPRGLNRVWLIRVGLWFGWAAATALVFLLITESRVTVRHSAAAEIAASLTDLVVFSAWASTVAHRFGSEVAGVLGGLILWFLGVLLGIAPPGPTWLRDLTPLSVYFFGPLPRLIVNRACWVAVAGLALWGQWRALRQPQTLLAARE